MNRDCFSAIGRILSKPTIIFALTFMVFTANSCSNAEKEILPIENDICLLKQEGNTTGGYSLAQTGDHHIFTILLQPDILEVFYDPSRIFIVKIDERGITSYHKINIQRTNPNVNKVFDLKKNDFYEQIKNKGTFKKILLTFDGKRKL